MSATSDPRYAHAALTSAHAADRRGPAVLGGMDMQRLFERIADHHSGTVECEEILPNYMRLLASPRLGSPPERFEVFAYECRSPEGATVPLVRVGHPDDGEPVLVSPIPSAILAVALR